MQIQSLDSVIYVGDEINALITKTTDSLDFSKVFLITDTNTHKLCLPLIADNSMFNNTSEIIVKPGEENKTIQTTEQIWKFLSNNGADRNSLVLILGGGVLCDMGGFAAATFKRGIKFITIPTTLLSQVDASIGGKLGVDLNGLKNEIGMFKTPHSIIISPLFLKTLDKEQILSGFAEMIKHAIVYGGEHLMKIKNFDIKNYDFSKLSGLITKSILIKNDIVHKDPKEKNLRKSLNFGHTFGHAFESFLLRKKEPIMHGVAVAHGMIAELALSKYALNLPKRILQEFSEYIANIYDEINLSNADFDEIYELMLHDKKNDAQNIKFALLRGAGLVEINVQASKEHIKLAYNEYLTWMNRNGEELIR
ncbi:MAG: 3-dehydroquinate synthase [Bacteroidales bacterium]|nr:3-dehydroquinate synthase [Bacteroidales bacterium]